MNGLPPETRDAAGQDTAGETGGLGGVDDALQFLVAAIPTTSLTVAAPLYVFQMNE